MKIQLVPTYLIELGVIDSNNRESFVAQNERADSFYLKMAPFFLGPKGKDGDDGEVGDTGTGNFLSTIDW